MVRRIYVKRLGLEVTPLTSIEVAEGIYKATSTRSTLRIGNHNLHGAYLYHTNEIFRDYCNSADWLLVDGWPIWLLLKLQDRKSPGTETRIGSSDWLKDLLEMGEPLTICAIGGTSDSSMLASKVIKESYPHIDWLGFDGFSHGRDLGTDMVEAITKAHVVLVGMGMPLQEQWILENSLLLESKVVANIGGCIDYIAGTQKHAPRWLGRLGLEWAYRFLSSPTRLAGRYFIEPLMLAMVLLKKRLTAIKKEDL